MNAASSGFRFLYRELDGRLDASGWWRGTLPLAVIVVVLTVVWLVIAPSGARDPTREAFYDPRAIAVNAFFIIYAFALIFCAVAHYFVGAKRFSDLGLPQGLAGLMPFAILVAGAGHWYAPRSEGTMPIWAAWIIDAFALGIVGWTIAVCGFRSSAARN